MTIATCKDLGVYEFISDGRALDYFYQDDMLMIPAMHGRPHRFSGKIITFVQHPNTMKDRDFEEMDAFIARYRDDFADPNELLASVKSKKKRSRGIMDRGYVFAMNAQRRLRSWYKAVFARFI